MVKYDKDQIRFAVDIAIGDDGHRSNEVIAILENEFKKEKTAPVISFENSKKRVGHKVLQRTKKSNEQYLKVRNK